MAHPHRKGNMKTEILARNKRMGGAASHDNAGPASRRDGKSNGESQPPQKTSEEMVEMRIMFAYSARKKTAKVIPEYSTWKPATISLSPSATSKGARLVSASPAMKWTANIGRSGSQNQPRNP